MVMSESTEEMNDAIDEMRARMSADDLAQWDAIQEWKAAQIRPIRPRVISQRDPQARRARDISRRVFDQPRANRQGFPPGWV